jgi:predicted ester cyclase
MSNIDVNEAVVRRLFADAWNGGDLDVVDELVSPEAVPAHGGGPPGPETWKEAIAFYRGSFADLSYTIEDLFAAGDKVAVRWTAEGTDSIGFMGRAPTGVTASVSGITIYRLEAGKLAEHWDEFDLAGLLGKLGVLPPLASSEPQVMSG